MSPPHFFLLPFSLYFQQLPGHLPPFPGHGERNRVFAPLHSASAHQTLAHRSCHFVPVSHKGTKPFSKQRPSSPRETKEQEMSRRRQRELPSPSHQAASWNLLSVPSTPGAWLVMTRDRAFSVAAPRTWNFLPRTVKTGSFFVIFSTGSLRASCSDRPMGN